MRSRAQYPEMSFLFLHAAVVEQERLDHAQGLRAAESELERLQDAVRPFIIVLQS